MYYPMQTFLVAGISRSGVAAAELLLKKHARAVWLYDDVSDEGVRKNIAHLTQLGCRGVSKEELSARVAECDVLILSPGIPIDHALPVLFRKEGKAIVGEAELAARELRCPVVAVTGTNGKTTTVSMIEHIFNACHKRAVACGNVGRPIADCLEELEEDGIAVAEISSFQLETLTSLRPHVAVFLNIAEDHLNRHYTMENYIYLKQRLMKNSAESEYVALNHDDAVLRTFAEKTRAQVVWFSTEERVNGAYIQDGAIWWREEKLASLADLPLEGKHNEANALAAVCACKLMGVNGAYIAAALKTFKGIRHRLQKIGEVDGITFLDDSKATNVDAAIKAVESVKGESVIILGGKDKGYSYAPLFAAIRHSGVVHAVLCGENAFRLLDAAVKEGFTQVTLCRPFDLAVRIAFLTAQKGQNVLLSPASASFDAFKSYEERGERFAALMEELKKERAALAAEGECANEPDEQSE